MHSKLEVDQPNKLKKAAIYRYALICILGLALILRLIGLNKGIWLDEGATLHRLYMSENIWTAIKKLRDYNKPPLYFLLLHLWSKINSSELFLRLPSVFFDIGTIVVVMRWMKNYSSLASILAGIYFSTLPIFLRYSQEIRPYSLLIFATALAFSFASRVIKESNQKLIYFGLAFSLSLALLTHLVGVMLIPTICVFIGLISFLDNKPIQWRKATVAIGIPCLIFILIKYFYLNNINYTKETWWMPSISVELFTSTINYIFGFPFLTLPNYVNHIITFAIFSIIILVTAFGNFRNNFPFLVAGIVFCTQIVIYSVLFVPIFWYRTILPGFVPIIAFMVLQITTIRQKRIQRALIIGFTILSLIFTVNWITGKAWQPVEANKPVAQLVKSQLQNKDLILFYPYYIQDSIQYYFNDLPSGINILSFDNLEEIKLKFQQNQLISQDGYSNHIFFIIRVDADLDNRKHLEIYSKLLDVIKSKFSRRLNLNVFLIPAHHLPFIPNFEIVPKMLSILESKLGKPSSYEDRKTYLVLKYNLP